jgi:hypothetical protein
MTNFNLIIKLPVIIRLLRDLKVWPLRAGRNLGMAGFSRPVHGKQENGTPGLYFETVETNRPGVINVD